MAGDRTEQPTPKRLKDARKEGQVARSREVDTAVVILAAFFVMRFAGESMWRQAEALTVDTYSNLDRFRGAESPGVELVAELGFSLMTRAIMMLLPLMLAIVALVLIVGVAQTGPLLAPKAIKPQFKRLNPIQGTKRLVASKQAYVNLAKTLLKFVAIGGVAALTFRSHWDEMIALGVRVGLMDSIRIIAAIGFDLALRVSVALILLAALDYMFQRYQHTQQLKMTVQQVKDEHKQTDGDPQVRAQAARMRRSLLQRAMQSVPKADVVLVNPTHYAVALQYDPMTSAAPVVVAKGADFMAQRIREIAAEHNIPVITNPPLCRAIYRAVPVGQLIPPDLYEAVAEILAFVYQLRTGRVRWTAA
jgi:flagellar biosynthesis protein FlhB